MKQVIFSLIVLIPLSGKGQTHGGIYGAFGYNSMYGARTGISDANGWQAGAWVEPMVLERLGIYAGIAYAQRAGVVEQNTEVSGDYVTLSIMPRIHVPAKSGDVNFIAAFGGYVGRLVENDEKEWDGGLSGQVGLGYTRLSVFFFAHRGIVDMSDFVTGGQRWSSIGVGVNVRLW